MPVDTRINIPFLPQESITNSILAAIQAVNENHIRQQQVGIQQQQANQQGALIPSEAAKNTAQAGQATAEAANVQAGTAAGLPKAQADKAAADAALAQTQAQLEQESNPIKKAILQQNLRMAQIEGDRAEATMKFFTATGGGTSGFDQAISGAKTTLGKLAPEEQAVLDAAEQSSRFDAMQGRPDALNHLQQAVSEISNNRRSVEVAKLFGQQRGDMYNKEYYNTDTGEVEQLTANEFLSASKENPRRYIQYSPTVQNTLKAQSLVNDIQDGIDNMKKVISDPKFNLSAGGRALLFEAQKNPESAASTILSGMSTQKLDPSERNYLMAMATLDERAMAMRGLQGQGSGSDQQREAIVRMLPGLLTADPGMAKQQLALFQNNLDNLNKMIPKIGKAGKTSAGQGGASGLIQPGDIEDGFRFKGGDRGDPKNWEKQ